jgi:hypothetical protein
LGAFSVALSHALLPPPEMIADAPEMIADAHPPPKKTRCRRAKAAA